MKDLTKIKEFLQSVGADLSKLDVNGRYNGDLSIRNNPQLTSLTFPEGVAFGGDLYICENPQLTSLTFPEGVAFGGDLYIRNNPQLTSLTFPEGVAFGGDLYICENPQLTSLTFPEGVAFGGYLSICENPQLTSLTFPEGVAFGGDLSIRNNPQLTSLTFPEGVAFGGYLSICENPQLNQKQWNVRESVDDGYIWTWRDRLYIKADGVFMRLLNRRGNVCKVAYIGRNKETYLVTDGAGKWAHGDTLEEAKRDLIYKISNRDTSRYKGLTLESELTHEEAIEAYRVITGACAAGTRNFCEHILPENEKRDKYKIREIVALTKGNYGAEVFRKFFEK